MNLLRYPWCVVRDGSSTRRATLEEILCSDEALELAARRDDLELATLQLLVSIVQVVLQPDDDAELRQRENRPLATAEYERAIEPFLSWFDLTHETTPFMQSRGVKASEPTPIQKLFIGLPEGNNHAFFNQPGEIVRACAPCIAVALFNQANNAPSFGGGFKGSLRGGAPITTLVAGPTLRRTVWRNVLTRSRIRPLYQGASDQPVWIDPVEQGQKVSAASIGLSRGLFWQPMRIELLWSTDDARCDSCDLPAPVSSSAFRTQKFTYELAGTWPHPHGPRAWEIKAGGADYYYQSFTTSAPAWTHLTGFLIKYELKKGREGREPAAVVSQFEEVFEHELLEDGLTLIVGGYRNKQAAVLERRHELISLAKEWQRNPDGLKDLVEAALGVKDALRRKMFGFAKDLGIDGLARRAEDAFYKGSEPLVHLALRAPDEIDQERAHAEVMRRLVALAEETFDSTALPYRHAPKALKAYATARRGLLYALADYRPKGETQ